MIQNYIFFCFGKMFQQLIHLLYIFRIKLFSPSEIIFTNDEHVFIRIWCFRLLFCYWIYKKSRLIKVRVYEFQSQISMLISMFNRFDYHIIKADPIMYVKWILSCKHTHLFEKMCHLYFSRYKLFNYKYVHNV